MRKLFIIALTVLVVGCSAQAQETIQLPQPDMNMLKTDLGTTLKQRRSGRSYDSNRQLTDAQLSTLLWASCGISEEKRGLITAPSAVNMQDIKVFVCAKDAPLSLLLVSDQITRNRKNEHFGAMDAGYVSQNIYLACTAMGLQTVARASMDTDTLRQELQLGDEVWLELNHPVGYGK